MQKKGTALRRAPKAEFVPPPVEAAAPLPVPAFEPVPRQYYRHDGWTPERQRAFIGALADTGCVRRAARMVNMAQTNCYTLRRAPGAEEFRRAWDAALDCGLGRLKDIAFERAIEGELIPWFVNGKLMGFRRKRNDALLMFCLRHYGQDKQGKRTTVNYFSSRASAGANAGASSNADNGSAAEASATSVRTVITGGSDAGPQESAERADTAASAVEGFAGVTLDAEARAAIMAALQDCATRAQEANAAYDRGGTAAVDAAEDDPDEPFVRVDHGVDYRGTLEPPGNVEFEEEPLGESEWWLMGTEKPDWAQNLDDGIVPASERRWAIPPPRTKTDR